jgi:RNA polymerase sigma factor for flagellar operon FliA
MPASQSRRVVAGLPFVEALARRMAATMPHSIDVGDLVQDGVIGLIDASHRFDEARGIKFETFAERRIRGAMIDALRRDAWPRGVRRVRRELEAAREALRRELGYEPSLADLAARVGSDEKRLGRTIVRINTIESTSPLATGENVDEACLPPALVPSEPDQPDAAFEKSEVRNRVRGAIAALPPRERKVIGLYYYGEVTMKQIGAEIGVNESRVSQLHARAIKRLRQALAPDMAPMEAVKAIRSAVIAFQQKPKMLKVEQPVRSFDQLGIDVSGVERRLGASHLARNNQTEPASAVVVPYARTARRLLAAPARRMLGRPQPVGRARQSAAGR